MEQKDFLDMCLDIYRYCRLYREQAEDEIGDFLYFFAAEYLVRQRIKEIKGTNEDWNCVTAQLEREQDGWLRLHREEGARGKEAMKFLREVVEFYDRYIHIEK